MIRVSYARACLARRSTCEHAAPFVLLQVLHVHLVVALVATSARLLNLASPDERGVLGSSSDRHHREWLPEGKMIDVLVIERLSLSRGQCSTTRRAHNE